MNISFAFSFTPGECPWNYGRYVAQAVYATKELQDATQALLVRHGDLLAHHYVDPRHTLEEILRRLEDGNPFGEHCRQSLVDSHSREARRFTYLWTVFGLERGSDALELHRKMRTIPEYIGMHCPSRTLAHRWFFDYCLDDLLMFDGNTWMARLPVVVGDLKRHGFSKCKLGIGDEKLFRLKAHLNAVPSS